MVLTDVLFTEFVFVCLIADFITIFLDISSDVTPRLDVKYSIRVILTIWQQSTFISMKVLSVLSVPGVVAVLFVGRTSFAIGMDVTISIICSTGYRGPECFVSAE